MPGGNWASGGIPPPAGPVPSTADIVAEVEGHLDTIYKLINDDEPGELTPVDDGKIIDSLYIPVAFSWSG